MKKMLIISLCLMLSLQLSVQAQQNQNNHFQLSGFVGPVQLGFSGQYDFNKRASMLLSTGVGTMLWDRELTDYSAAYTKENSHRGGGAFEGMFGSICAWSNAFIELQGRYFLKKTKANSSSNFAQGLFIGTKIKFNSAAFSIRYNADPNQRMMSTTQFMVNAGLRKSFKQERTYIDFSAGLGGMANQDFWTTNMVGSLCFRFGIRIV